MRVEKKYTVLVESSIVADLVAVTGKFLIEDETETGTFRVISAENLQVEDGIILTEEELEELMEAILDKYRASRGL